MKKIVAIIWVVLLLFSGVSRWAVFGENGFKKDKFKEKSIAKEEKILKKTMFYGETITAIDVMHLFSVTVVRGSDNYVKLEYNEIFDDLLSIELDKGVLTLALEGNSINIKEKQTLKAVVCVSDLTSLTASGNTDIQLIGEFTPESLRVRCSGNSDIQGLTCRSKNADISISGNSDFFDCDIEAERIALSASGNSDMKNLVLKGENAEISLSGNSSIWYGGWTFEEADIQVSAASEVSYIRCDIKSASLTLSGSSDFRAKSFTTDELDLTAGGSSDFQLSGKCRLMTATLSGTAGGKCRNFVTDELIINMTGCTEGEFAVEKELSVFGSKSSEVTIYGHPKVKNRGYGEVRFY